MATFPAWTASVWVAEQVLCWLGLVGAAEGLMSRCTGTAAEDAAEERCWVRAFFQEFQVWADFENCPSGE